MNTGAVALSPLSIAEQALLWRQLMQHTPGGIFGLEAVRAEHAGDIVDFRYRFINAVALHDAFRRQPDQQHDVTGQLFSTYFPSIRQSPLWDLYLTVLNSQQAIEGEGAYLFDGHSLRVHMAISPVSPDSILISYNEISENHQAKQALQLQSVRAQHMLNSSPHAMVVVDAVRDADERITDFRISVVNELFARMTGQPAESFINMPLDRIYTFRPGQWEALIRLMDTGVLIRHEEYLAPHGRWIDMVLTRVDGGFVVTLQDVTDQKKSLDQLERQARLLNGLMHTVQNGISVLEAIRDPAGRLTDFCFIEISEALLTGLGLQRGQVIGNQLLTILPGLRDTTIWPVYLRVLETGVPHQFEHHYTADGYERYFDLSVARLNDGLVVSYSNITDAKLAQLQLETLVIELRRSNESLDQFAYVASHDLQEPLRKIVSFGDVLQQQFAGELSESAADMIQRMQYAAGRMRILVQDLLTYSRLTGHPALYKPVLLDQVLTDVLASFADIITDRGAGLTCGSLPAVRGDENLLGQLFQNLISNALKFSRAGQPPRITITGQLVQNPDALPTVGHCAEISITDDGIGFDEKYLDRIFTVFQRLHGQQHYAGTGIGRPSAKKLLSCTTGPLLPAASPVPEPHLPSGYRRPDPLRATPSFIGVEHLSRPQAKTACF